MDTQQRNFQLSTSIVFPISVLALVLFMLFINSIYEKRMHYLTAQTEISVLSTPRKIEPFNLTTSDNKNFTEENLLNHWTFLFLSSTSCGDTCATTLSALNLALEKLKEQYSSLQMVFVSVDPEHDSPDLLNQYVQQFNQSFIGVTGEKNQLITLQKQLGMLAQHVPSKTASYHPNVILLINPEGKLQAFLSSNMPFQRINDQFLKIVDRYEQ